MYWSGIPLYALSKQGHVTQDLKGFVTLTHKKTFWVLIFFFFLAWDKDKSSLLSSNIQWRSRISKTELCMFYTDIFRLCGFFSLCLQWRSAPTDTFCLVHAIRHEIRTVSRACIRIFTSIQKKHKEKVKELWVPLHEKSSVFQLLVTRCNFSINTPYGMPRIPLQAKLLL